MDVAEDIMNLKEYVKSRDRQNPSKKEMDELGIEPKTSPMLRERATNCATRPVISCLVYQHLIISQL